MCGPGDPTITVYRRGDKFALEIPAAGIVLRLKPTPPDSPPGLLKEVWSGDGMVLYIQAETGELLLEKDGKLWCLLDEGELDWGDEPPPGWEEVWSGDPRELRPEEQVTIPA